MKLWPFSSFTSLITSLKNPHKWNDKPFRNRYIKGFKCINDMGNPFSGSFPGGKSHRTSFGDFPTTFDYQRVAFDPRCV